VLKGPALRQVHAQLVHVRLSQERARALEGEVMSLLSSWETQRLQDAADAADAIASTGHEGGRIVAEVAGDAIAEELNERKGWWS